MPRKTPPGGFKHGESGYANYGCRCDICTQANTEKLARIRGNNADERIEVDGRMIHPLAKHGTLNGYQYYKCRCRACTDATRQ